MAYASRLYPRAKPRGFTLQWIKNEDYEVESLTLRMYVLENQRLKLIKTVKNVAPQE